MKAKEFRHEINKLDMKKYNGLSTEDASVKEKELVAEQLTEVIDSPLFQEYYESYKARCRELDQKLDDIITNIPDLPMAQVVYLAPYIKEALVQMKSSIGTNEYVSKFEIEDRLYEHYNVAVMKLSKNETFSAKKHEYTSIENTIDFLIQSYDKLIVAAKNNQREEMLEIFASQTLPNFDLLLHM